MSKLRLVLRPALSLALVGSAIGACASQTALPAEVRAGIQERFTGQTVELRQSCFFGDLYDDNTKWLLSPHAFDHTHHIVDWHGKPIHPHEQRGIVRAGTQFRIHQIEFPDPKGLAQRMLTTPRYNPWIYLTPVDDSVRLPRERHYWVLLLPRDLEDGASVEREIARLLAPKGEMRAWLGERRPKVRVAIEHKDLLAGMSIDEMIAAMGDPRLVLEDEKDGQPVQVVWFGIKEAWLRGSDIVEVRPGREAAPPAAR